MRMSRAKFLRGFRTHLRKVIREKDNLDIVEETMKKMEEGKTYCPFVWCLNMFMATKEAAYYHRYRGPAITSDIACQMVQVYCEVMFY